MTDEQILERLKNDDAKRFFTFYRTMGHDQTTALLMTLENIILDLKVAREEEESA